MVVGEAADCTEILVPFSLVISFNHDGIPRNVLVLRKLKLREVPAMPRSRGQ